MNINTPTLPRRSPRLIKWVWPVVVGLLLVLAAFSTVRYGELREDSYAVVRDQFAIDVVAEAGEFYQFMAGVEMSAENLAQMISDGEISRDSYIGALKDLVESDGLYYGGAIAFAPYAYDPDVRLYAPYYAKKDDSLEYMQIEDSYDYTLDEQTWFGEAMASGSRWSAPYFDDAVGDILMTTYSAVIYQPGAEGQKKPIGVVTIDISIDDIGLIMQSLNYGSGFG